MAAATELAYEMRGVVYAYNEVRALDYLSLSITRGDRVALLGANGSGKSTLLRLMAALDFPAQGSIKFAGELLSKSSLEHAETFYRFRRAVGIVFQNSDVQLFNASVFDEVAFGPLQLGWRKDQVRQQVEETLTNLGILNLKDRAPHRLSGGEKKRVALASVLITEPEVLLLDEPLAGLDPGSQTQMVELIASWPKGTRTIITCTHDLAALESIADRCVVLQNGTVAGEGPALDILHNVPLLESTGLIRPHRHVHHTETEAPHPHIHRP